MNTCNIIVDCYMHSLHVGTGWSIRITIRHVDRPTKNLSTKIPASLEKLCTVDFVVCFDALLGQTMDFGPNPSLSDSLQAV